MRNYILRRIITLLPLLFGISIISFTVIHLAPGKPTDISAEFNPKASSQAREQLEKLYGLDKPIHIQYINWIKRITVGDFGNSFRDGRKVIDKIKERIPITLTINILSLLLILSIGIPIGVRAALNKGGLFDRITTVAVFIGFAMPGFWIALLLMWLFSVHLGWLPVSGIKSLDFANFGLCKKLLDLGWHLILPVFISAFGSLAGISRYMRTSMLEVIDKDYIRTAFAKGLPEKTVIYKHAFRNAVLPIVTILGLSVPGLLGGSVIFESIFAIPGMGRLFFTSVMSRDYPVIMAVLIIGAVLTLLGNLIADISYAFVDPRIRYGR